MKRRNTRKRTTGGMDKMVRQYAKRNLLNNTPSLYNLQEQYKQILQARGESPVPPSTPKNNTRKSINLEERFKRLSNLKAQLS